jgi:hypothetical protein
MLNFRQFLTSKLNSPKYGDLMPHFEDKIDPNDKFIKYFLNDKDLVEKYRNLEYPDEFQTLTELKMLEEIMSNVSEEDLQFAMNAETDQEDMYRKFMKDYGINLPATFISDILKQTDPILFYMKKYFNRARPEQFANANKIPFTVLITNSADHPSYPSGHAFDSYLLSNILSRIAPHISREINDFAHKMRMSRIHVGLHYPSDNIISQHLANDVLASGLLEIPSQK